MIETENGIIQMKNEKEDSLYKSKNRALSHIDVATKSKRSVKRSKGQLRVKCPERSLSDIEETCPTETSRILLKYECCIQCPGQETGYGCEVHNCTAVSDCLSIDLSTRSVPSVHLDLSRAQLSVLPSNIFHRLPNLTSINLFNNNISVLPVNVFNDLHELTSLTLNSNNLTVLHNDLFAGLTKLSNLRLGYNKIKFLTHNIFSGLSQLSRLDLSANELVTVPNNVFGDLSKLTSLSLSNNLIIDLPYNTFSGLSDLTNLYMSGNKITTLHHSVFDGLYNLTDLYLNNITKLPNSVFHGLSKLTRLMLVGNYISDLPHDVFRGLNELTELSLGDNNISVLPHDVFFGLTKLTTLHLSDNNLVEIPFDLLVGLSKLSSFHLHNNTIKSIPRNVFTGVMGGRERYQWNKEPGFALPLNLQILDVGNNELKHLPDLPRNLTELNIIRNKLNVEENMFKGLDNLQKLWTDVPFMCCVKPPSVKDANCIETQHQIWTCDLKPEECGSKGDAISSCDALVSSQILRTCLWIIGISALIGNVVVIVYRLFIDRENITKNYSLFTLNLAISDLLMGVYLLIIGAVDVYYDGAYAWNDRHWRNSIFCTMAGVLSNVSSEMSTFLILLVTLDRLIVIMFPLSRLSRWSITWKPALILSLSLWVVSIALAIIPIVAMQSYFRGEFYSQSSVCLALPLRKSDRPGTGYSFAVFVCLNSIIFVAIVVSQVCICKSIRTSSRRITSSQNRQREISVARTLFFVAATDFCCWCPIGILGVVARCGVEIPNGVYAWVMVFVLPINAAINPFLYTASAVWRRRQNGMNNSSQKISAFGQIIPSLRDTEHRDGSLSDIEETCPAETSRELLKYECCIQCPGQETGYGCEVHNCTAVYDCLSIDLPPSVYLHLSSAQLSVLPINIFHRLPNLTSINLFNNSISVLPVNAFDDLHELTILTLTRNNLTVFQNDLFAGLTKLSFLSLDYNKIKFLTHNMFSGLSQLSRLDLSSNELVTVPNNVFSELSKLTSLSLSNNLIIDLPYNTFSGLSDLTNLYLHNNSISSLPHNVFDELYELKYIFLYHNHILNLPCNVFNGLSNLASLILNDNNISDLPHDVFRGLNELTELNLGNTNISVLPHDVFFGLTDLTTLHLSDNRIKHLPHDLFSGLSKLDFLSLFNNSITVLPNNIFSGLVELKVLDISHNNLVEIPFAMPLNLQILDVGNNELKHLPDLPRNLTELNIIRNKLSVEENMFKGLDNLQKLWTDVPFMCCVKPPSVEDANCIETQHQIWHCDWKPEECGSKGDAISSCDALVSSQILRTCLWIIGISALIGNVVVIVYRLFIDRGNITKNYSLFTLNLGISDLLMGVYLLIIGAVDVYYDGAYAWNDRHWRNSIFCTMAGVLSNVSSEMSTFLILLVTLDRLIVIMFPLSRLSKWSITWKPALILSLSLWVVSIALAIIPIVAMQSYFKGEFYSQSSVCLALPLIKSDRPGTGYSFAVFVCLNSIIFVAIVVSQVCICKSIRTSSRRITSSQNRQREISVARTLFFVAATDFCCWCPIGILGVVTRCGVEIPNGVYAWVMVFVLPINAAINPFLYTASAVWRRRQNSLSARKTTVQTTSISK
ncbi:uncharacterized protein LOC132561863 [Ylistrum balloti]|uniref:uncharacterized protein LOC132561863 n=1 Tax=Ylistrum balloti TaxID=509963 RepID=UPI002905F60D|nr:uncharacterized protein LOC132561863 [Ylistrum balloti]